MARQNSPAPELAVHDGGAGAATPDPGPGRAPVQPTPEAAPAAGYALREDEVYARMVLAFGVAFAATTFATLAVWFNVVAHEPTTHAVDHAVVEATPPTPEDRVAVAATPVPAPLPVPEPAATPPEPVAVATPEPVAAPAPAPTTPPKATTTTPPKTATKATTTPPKTTTTPPRTTTTPPKTTTAPTPPPATTPDSVWGATEPATTTTTVAVAAAGAPTPAQLTGTYMGRTLGRALALDLDFRSGGKLGATIRLHDGTTTISVPAEGSYTVQPDGSVTLSFTESGVSDPAAYSGALVGGNIDGKVTVAGRNRGRFNARR